MNELDKWKYNRESMLQQKQYIGVWDHGLSTNFGTNPRQQSPNTFGGPHDAQHIQKWAETVEKQKS